ncbi:hypothetical protein ACQKOE_13170 [Novosphingobium sp. NPDC080210]|uniref:hypothetical protein n=1 Tax=Novosphingobium sp. NPDC080210 TaxID=3390596 RepID=UPI003D004634
MSGDPKAQRARWLGYEIQQIFANEILTRDSASAEAAREFLIDVGCDIESRSNKIAPLSVRFRSTVLNLVVAVFRRFARGHLGGGEQFVP